MMDMKKTFLLALGLVFLLGGCRARETMETVMDELETPVMMTPREIFVEIPPEAEAAAVESGFGRMYLCDDYEISVQTLESGNLGDTLKTLTGYGLETISPVETRGDGWLRYDFAWATQGEGTLLGRGAILDDGQYHYCLSVLRPAESENSQVVWSRVFQSFSID